MILPITSLTDPKTTAQLNMLADELSWGDGRATAGATAKAVKQNEQARFDSPSGHAFLKLALTALSQHPVLQAAARPRRMSNLILSRTENGGHYGPHVDNAVMKKNGESIRTDLSFTLFLTDPQDYEGGELVIQSAGVLQSIKLGAGDLILYPSTSIHEVKPVTRGTRRVCVGWIESQIADGAQREMLFGLQNLRVSLKARSAPADERLILDQTIANLLRMWAVV